MKIKLISLVLLGVMGAIFSGSVVLVNQNIFAQQEGQGNQVLETNTITLQYPTGWEGEVSTNRFDVQDFTIKDPSNDIVIMGFDNELDLPRDFPKELYKENKEIAYEGFVKGNLQAFKDRGSASKIESYDLGEIKYGNLPAYADLYKVNLGSLDIERGMLLTMVFYDDDNMKTYATLSTAPVDIYDKVEPKIMQVLNSITFKE
jgi:hypothetical protein